MIHTISNDELCDNFTFAAAKAIFDGTADAFIERVPESRYLRNDFDRHMRNFIYDLFNFRSFLKGDAREYIYGERHIKLKQSAILEDGFIYGYIFSICYFFTSSGFVGMAYPDNIKRIYIVRFLFSFLLERIELATLKPIPIFGAEADGHLAAQSAMKHVAQEAFFTKSCLTPMDEYLKRNYDITYNPGNYSRASAPPSIRDIIDGD